MNNKPFPENFDLKDGKRTVFRLNAARVQQMREHNRTLLNSLREMSDE